MGVGEDVVDKLTERQQRFADDYVRTGNITQSYLNSYQNVKKESTASAAGSRLLRNVNVKAYIDERLDKLKKQSIAEQDEILQTLTSILRGKEKGKTKIGLGMGEEGISDIGPSVAERIRAAEQLGKRYGMWTDKLEVEDITPVFIEDIPDED